MKILITDYCYKRYLLIYKAKPDNHNFDYKLMSKDEFFSSFFFEYKKDKKLPNNPIPLILKGKKYDYSAASKLKRILQVGYYQDEESDSERLKAVKKELQSFKSQLESQKAIVKDDLFSYEIKNSEIYLFESDDDFELKEALKRNKIRFKELHFSNLEEPKKEPKGPRSLIFSDKTEQFLYIFADIRKQIIKEKKDPSTIAVLLQSEADFYYCDLFSDLFDIKIEKTISTPLSNIPSVKKYLNNAFETKKITIDENEQDEDLTTLYSLIKDFGLVELSKENFDFAFITLQEIVSSHIKKEKENNNGVKILTDILFDPNLLFYMTDYNSDVFYKIFDDNSIYPDDILKELKVNPSYIRSKLDRRKKLNFLLHNSIAFVSRVKLHLSDKIYDSPFVTDKECETWPKAEKASDNIDGLYTKKAASFLTSIRLDELKASPNQMLGYRDYNHSASPVSLFNPQKEFKVTELEAYNSCPFKYLLENKLGLNNFDPKSDDFAARFGSFVHKIMENIFESDFDYDTEFENVKAECLDKKTPRSLKEEVFLEVIKPKMKVFIDHLHEQVKPDDIEKIEKEFDLTLSLSSSSGKEYKLKGRADRIVVTKSDSFKYYTIIDYKTGHPDTFEYKYVCEGGALQLPLYKLAYDEMEAKEFDYKFGGVGIQHPYSKKALKADIKAEDKQIESFTKLCGLLNETENYQNNFGNKKYLKADFPFKNVNSVAKKSNYTVSDLFDDAKQAAIKTMNSINEQKFDIAPKQFKNNSEPACMYCNYKDVCYHKRSDFDSAYKRIDAIFSESNEEAEE